ncbi:hypothetical protein OG936_37560 [Streptomyces sp. NBC_00846]|uniref:hypothetical protein n=1 Tax=Streptomyces sp. NBC_00846 TaxID=2975849 RepID=UPI0038656A2F|nr:hypothetical protein OG936_37560 [Streptomyces sp. NBC_00846]
MTDWQDFEWVVWRLEVQDPQQLAGEDPDLDERTQETMTELAASLGCVYELCVDYDSYDDETPYYAWWVRVPTAEHARRGENGLPVAVDRLHRYLAGQLPDLPHWEIVPDQERTVDHAASSAMRGAYDDLITPFERALMPLRRDGADALDPRAKVWKWEKDLLVGTFDLWLCNDPDRPHTWLVVTVGLWTEPQLFDEEPAARLGHFGFTPAPPTAVPAPPDGPVDLHRPRGVGRVPWEEHVQGQGRRRARHSTPMDSERPRRPGRAGYPRSGTRPTVIVQGRQIPGAMSVLARILADQANAVRLRPPAVCGGCGAVG